MDMRDHDIPRNFHNPREVIEMGTVTLPSNWGEQCVNRRGPGKEAVTVITEGVKSRPRTLAFIHWMTKHPRWWFSEKTTGGMASGEGRSNYGSWLKKKSSCESAGS